MNVDVSNNSSYASKIGEVLKNFQISDGRFIQVVPRRDGEEWRKFFIFKDFSDLRPVDPDLIAVEIALDISWFLSQNEVSTDQVYVSNVLSVITMLEDKTVRIAYDIRVS